MNLNGTWRLTGIPPDGGEHLKLAGAVPGHVHVDLLREKRIPDPFWRDQAEACQWVEKWDWVYEREFTLDSAWARSWAALEFGGLDTFAAVSLNGQEVGRTANMFIPHRFEVGPMLKPGRNRIAVHFDSIWKHVAGKPPEHECAFGTPERIYVRRMQCTFRWDWVNRFVSCGIWKPVRLAGYDRARISDAFVRTLRIERPGGAAAESADLLVGLETEQRTGAAITAKAEIFAPGCKQPAWTASGEIPAGQASWRARLEAPKLWWPNGCGRQPLYTLRCALAARDGTVLDSRELRFGIRTLELEQQDDAPGSAEEARTRELRVIHKALEAGNGDAPGRSFIVRVNGKRIFCRGGNWVPCDPWPSRVTRGWYERLLRLARDGSVNCLRGWGGGIYEPDAFWDCCDRMGILVCQDFQMACARYPQDDPEFRAEISREIPAAIRMLRNHPSLAWWSGDNESGMDFDWDAGDCWGHKIIGEITAPALRELDPGRPFFPTSPFGGRGNTCMTIGDVHTSAMPTGGRIMEMDWEHYRTWIDNAVGRFNSESGTIGSPGMFSLRRFMAAEDFADPAGPVWYYHTKDNPYSDTRLFDAQRMAAEKLFGPADNFEQRVRHLEHIQHEWVRHSMEAARRRKWYCAGLLFWMYNDCWPATGWSLVDYYGAPKAGWYAMRRAGRPVIAAIEDAGDSFRIWACNDTLSPVKGRMSLRIQGWSGPPIWEQAVPVRMPENSSIVAARLLKAGLPPVGLDAVLVADLKAGKHADRAWHFAGLPFQMAPPPVKLAVRREPRKGRREAIVIKAESYARVVTLEAGIDFSDNYFDLLPGEERRIEWIARPEAGPIPIRCWNGIGEVEEPACSAVGSPRPRRGKETVWY